MKRFIRSICLLMVLTTVLAIPAMAAESWDNRSSSYFSSYDAYLHWTSSSQFQVWFNVTGTGRMDEIGASSISIQRKPTNGSAWETVATYSKTSCPSLIAYNTVTHSSYVGGTKASGYTYRAYVTFYAKNSSGTGYYYAYAY
jgi:hypothetical protein